MFRPQAGMTDPYINETVTYVAELDEEAIRKEIWQPFLCFFIFNLILGIIVPLFCIIPWIMFCCVMNHANSTAEGTQVYITENTLVYVEGDQFSRVTVPLTSIATVMVQPPDLLINIKPTAPKEVLSLVQVTVAVSLLMRHLSLALCQYLMWRMQRLLLK